ncbi:phage tail terminator-like protein [Mesorhizobium sp.]|uniref:phage tail terminator-like protein n=1 Tax=Mesorhizobium sp. TaxID=1871066 RepID=UPI000FE63D53|nr:phage tail terminator-like protein [Mesorhizobium sp.]RWE96468.1 MAG: hypothetical protein EOS43_22465 [Mesorhizobium sp.]
MPTLQSSIEAALFARVAALVLSPVLPIAWPNVAFTKPTTGYLRVNHTPNAARRLFIAGTDPHQRMGLLQVDAFQKLNAGASAATETAGLIAAWFPCDLPLFQDGIRVRVTKAPDVAGALSDDTHWMVPVTVSYEVFA